MNSEDFPLSDTIDTGILMHRDVHFGGRFEPMLEYYEKDGKGVVPDYDIVRIRELQSMEQRLNQNIAAMLLSGPDADRVAEAKNAYKKLRNVYEKKLKSKIPLLIADLILSEEEDPQQEIRSLAAEKSDAVPALLDLLRAEEFYDPLFPGYGCAPSLAIKCLALIGDKRAIIGLFEAIGESDFFSEDIALEALHAIGKPAKDFLLKVLHGKPLNFDNERAAIALSRFKEDPEVAESCLKMLQEIDLSKQTLLAEYLILACEGLVDSKQRSQFLSLAELSTTPKQLALDIRAIASQK